MQIHPVEGNTQRLDGGAMFGNAPREMWKRWIEPDERNRIPLAARSLFVEHEGKRLLFDVGVGAFFDPKMRDRYGVMEEEHLLLKNLAALGIEEESIDCVVLSHLHFDHAGGILSAFGDGDPRLLFPNAEIITSKENWERANKPHPRDRASFIPHLNELLEKSGRLTLTDANRLPGYEWISLRYVHGHTPGLMLSEVETEEGPLVFAADLIPGLPWVHIPITMGYDRFPELVIEEKRHFLEEMIERKGRLFFTHDPTIPIAEVRKNEKGKFFGEPIVTQSEASL